MFNKIIRYGKLALLWSVVAVIGLIMSGCASGVKMLGQAEVFGKVIEYVQIGSKGETGPKLVVIEGYMEHHEGVIKVSEYSASGNSLTGQILGGSAAAALAAGGNVGAAAMRRPNTTRVAVSGTSGSTSGAISGGSSSDATSGSSSDATSGSSSDATSSTSQSQVQVQDQVQAQGQGQSQTQEAQGGCPGNSCGQGGNGQNGQEE